MENNAQIALDLTIPKILHYTPISQSAFRGSTNRYSEPIYLKSVFPENPFLFSERTCHLCGLYFSSKKNVQQHIREVHKVVTPATLKIRPRIILAHRRKEILCLIEDQVTTSSYSAGWVWDIFRDVVPKLVSPERFRRKILRVIEMSNQRLSPLRLQVPKTSTGWTKRTWTSSGWASQKLRSRASSLWSGTNLPNGFSSHGLLTFDWKNSRILKFG